MAETKVMKTLNGYEIVDAKARDEIERIRISDEKPLVYIDGYIPTTKQEGLATMRVESTWLNFVAYIKIKCQGSSSMEHPKKNFTVKLYKDEDRTIPLEIEIPGWKHPSNKFVLKANWVDSSHARNVVSAKLWGEIVASRPDYDTLPEELRMSPNNGAIDGFPIIVTTNGAYQGVYTWNIGKDAWLWGMDEDNTNHVLLCGETNTVGTGTDVSATNFREPWSGTDEDDWTVEVGTNSDAVKNAFNAIHECLNLPDEECKEMLNRYLDVQSAIDYDLFACVDRGVDNIARNMLLGTYDLKKWICGHYDMDMTWGIPFGEGYGHTDAEHLGSEYHEQNSLLWERIESLFVEEMKERGAYLRSTVLSYGNIMSKFEQFINTIGATAYEDDVWVYSEIPNRARQGLRYFREFVKERLEYFDKWISVLGREGGVMPTAVYAIDEPVVFTEGSEMIDTGVCIKDKDKSFTFAVDFTDTVGEISNTRILLGIADPQSAPNSDITIRCNEWFKQYLVRVGYAGDGSDAVYIETGINIQPNCEAVIVVRHEGGSSTFDVTIHTNGQTSTKTIPVDMTKVVTASPGNIWIGGLYDYDWQENKLVPKPKMWYGTINRFDFYDVYLTDAEVNTYINA